MGVSGARYTAGPVVYLRSFSAGALSLRTSGIGGPSASFVAYASYSPDINLFVEGATGSLCG